MVAKYKNIRFVILAVGVTVKKIGNCILYHGDCIEVMQSLNDIHAIVTDPPYGIGEHGGKFRDRKGGGHRVLDKKSWDNSIPDQKIFEKMLAYNVPSLIWGGNYFTDFLPQSRGWIYWDKLMGGDFSDGELAWTNKDKILKKVTHCNKYKGKQHPTQKPVEVMEFSISYLQLAKSQTNILDPFMGSGSTLVACAKMNKTGIGIEKDKDYFEIACNRVEQAYSQPDMFYGQDLKQVSIFEKGA